MIGLHTQQLLLGTWRMPKLDLKDATRLLNTAYEHGIHFLDTAYVYAEGESEKLLGKALCQSGIPREKLRIQSKTGSFLDRPYHGYDYSRDHILKTVDESLKRLNTDYLDVLLLHRPDAIGEPDEVAEAFDRLYDSGKVRHFGVSNFNPRQIDLYQRSIKQPLEFNQLQFSLTHTGMIDSGLYVNTKFAGSYDHDGGVMDYCRLNRITIQTWSPFQHSTDTAESVGIYLDREKFPQLNKKLDEVADRCGVSPAAIVIAWIMRHPARMQVVIGTTNRQRLADIVQGQGIQLTRQDWYELFFAAGNRIY